jgi:hypothetical protein
MSERPGTSRPNVWPPPTRQAALPTQKGASAAPLSQVWVPIPRMESAQRVSPSAAWTRWHSAWLALAILSLGVLIASFFVWTRPTTVHRVYEQRTQVIQIVPNSASVR